MITCDACRVDYEPWQVKPVESQGETFCLSCQEEWEKEMRENIAEAQRLTEYFGKRLLRATPYNVDEILENMNKYAVQWGKMEFELTDKQRPTYCQECGVETDNKKLCNRCNKR